MLKHKYYPGDIGFDPLGLKPKNALDFENIETKELSNGSRNDCDFRDGCARAR